MKAGIFPGQGSQFSGMGTKIMEKRDGASDVLDKANEILGFDIKHIMTEGSEEDLKKTEIAQLSILIYSYCLIESVDDYDIKAVAGHSLGEYSALLAAGALDLESALLLVKARATAMNKAVEENPGSMAAVIGMDDTTVEKTCKAQKDYVTAANYNSPGQVVISGTREGIKTAIQEFIKNGARKVIPLKVAGAFHSELMKPALDYFTDSLNRTVITPPLCPIYQNVDGQPTTDPNQIRINLKNQITSPVRWTQTIQNIKANGAIEFVEYGPGNVLTGLVRRIDKELAVRRG